VSIEEMRRLDALKTYKELQEAKERIKHLENSIRKTLDDNRHLADGENCTLIELKKALPEWT
jgi:predicted  nucleic acid-binding Zn-ribbon protein